MLTLATGQWHVIRRYGSVHGRGGGGKHGRPKLNPLPFLLNTIATPFLLSRAVAVWRTCTLGWTFLWCLYRGDVACFDNGAWLLWWAVLNGIGCKCGVTIFTSEEWGNNVISEPNIDGVART